MPAAIPKELQDAVNQVAWKIMAKLKIRGPVVITINPPPDAPTAFAATPSLSGIALRWIANTENDLAVAPYKVYRSTNGTTYTQLGTAQAGLTYADSTARAGTLYYYQVTASDNAANESAPATLTATRPSPPAVTNFSATPTPGHDVALSWTASTDPAHAGYPLYRSVSGGAFTLLGTPTATTYTDTLPAQNVPLVYRIFDQNSVADVGLGADVSTTIDTAAPAAVTNLRVTGTTSSSISLAWDAVTDPGLAGYRVERSVGGAAFATLAASQSPTTYTDTGVSSGFPYTYRVSAIDNSANVSAPATITASIPAPPSAPANLTATATTGGIALAWTAVSGAISYRVSSALSAGGTFSPVGSPVSNSYNDTAAATGVTTFYRVWAVDALNQAGAVATVSAVRPVAGGTGFPKIGVGASAVTAASVTVAPLGHVTHFSAYHLITGGQRWESKRFQWSLGEPGTQTVTDPRTNATVDLSTQQEGPKAIFLYTTAGQKNVTLTVTNEDGTQQTYAAVASVPPAGRTVTPVGSSRTLKTMADIQSHAADNTEFVIDPGEYTQTSGIRLRRNMVIRAASPGVTITGTGAITMFDGWPGQTQNATVSGIDFTSTYTSALNGDGTPYHFSNTSLVTGRGENIAFVDCTAAVMNETWKGSNVDLTVDPPTSTMNGLTCLRCRATDPIGIRGRTFWIEGLDVAVVGGLTLNSMSESPMRNANTSAIYAYVAYNDVKQTLDPANHRSGAKACATFRALQQSVIRCNRFGGGNPKGGELSFDPHTGDAHNRHNLVEQNLIYDQITIQGNNHYLLLRNNVFDRRGGNYTAISVVTNGLPNDALQVVNNTMIGDSPHQPLIYVGNYDPAALPHLVTALVVANNLIVNPALVPVSGNAYSNSMTFSVQDVPAISKITGNIHPDVLDWHGGKKLIYVGKTTLSPDYMLSLVQWNALVGGVDVQSAVTVNSNFAPGVGSLAAVSGVASALWGAPQSDYYGQASAAHRVGAVNPV